MQETCSKRLTLQGASAAVAVGGPLRQLHAVGAVTRHINNVVNYLGCCRHEGLLLQASKRDFQHAT